MLILSSNWEVDVVGCSCTFRSPRSILLSVSLVVHADAVWCHDEQTNGILFMQIVCPSLELLDLSGARACRLQCGVTTGRRMEYFSYNLSVRFLLHTLTNSNPTKHQHHQPHTTFFKSTDPVKSGVNNSIFELIKI